MIEQSVFVNKEIPNYHPLTMDYRKFWKEEKRRCIEGHWVSGKWMPGSLYFYVNYFTIKLNLQAHSKTKSYGKPFLRDLEWMKHYYYNEARGFSGFEKDLEYTCHRDFIDKVGYKKELTGETVEEHIALNDDGTVKQGYHKVKYVDARDYMSKFHDKNYGKPLYENEARNIVDIESRGTGKSYTVAGIAAQHFLFDGMLDYNQLTSNPSSETLIGAIDSFYSKELISKIKVGIDKLPGEYKAHGELYPSPFSKSYTGSWQAGKSIKAQYEQKEGSNFVTKGSGSIIHHKSFKDNPLAANGTRAGLNILEEVGFFNVLLEALGQLKECTMNGAYKFGVIWMTGTGGDMSGGSTQAVQEVFYNPEAYDCISFKDIYENSAKPIGMFVPAYMGLNQFKDEKGETQIEPAKDYLVKYREKLAKSQTKSALNDELQQRPLLPSEAFLAKSGTVFPTADLKNHLRYLESIDDDYAKGINGEVVITSEGKVEFIPDIKGVLQPADYPVKEGDQQKGCVTIWGEVPTDIPNWGQYIAAVDPYSQDEAVNSVSLGSVLIFKRHAFDGEESDTLVAEYTGRPATAAEFYENVRRLCILFNAECLYENQFNGLKMHFQQKQSLNYLSYTPTILKATANSKVSRIYGIHMTKTIKEELEIYARDWLLEDIGEGRCNMHKIYSKPLLKELIAYNDTGNFDRVIAFLLIITLRNQKHDEKVRVTIERKIDPFFTRRIFT